MKIFLQKKICPHLVLSAFILIAIAFPSCSLLNSTNVDEGGSVRVVLPAKNDRAIFTREDAASYRILLLTEEGDTYREATPTSDDTVEFENIPFGKYKVTIKALSFDSKTVAKGQSELFDVKSSDTVTVAIELFLNQYFNITYILDGGTNSPLNPSRYTVDEELVLAIPEKEMYYFEGWFTEETFVNRVESIAMGSTEEFTLYAKWLLRLEYYDTVPTSGTHLVTCEGDLRKISEWANGGTTVTFSGVTFELANDIALSPDKTWKSIGYGNMSDGTTAGFKGTFDGAGHEISGLKIDTTSVEGSKNIPAFFGCISGGTVKNLTLRGTSVRAGFTGCLAENGKIENCVNYVDVVNENSSLYASGGFVGSFVKGYVSDCVNYGNITSASYSTGGIAGETNGGLSSLAGSYISGCRNYGDLTSKYSTGGIIGFSMLAVFNCQNHGNITSTGTGTTPKGTGGIAGSSWTKEDVELIVNCLNTGDITGKGNVGGICGGLGTSWSSDYGYTLGCSIKNSVNLGTVSLSSGTATSYGGITGNCYGNEKNTYVFTIENSFGLTSGCSNTVGEKTTGTNITITNGSVGFDGSSLFSVAIQLNQWASSHEPAASGSSYKTWKVSGSTISF